MNVNQATSIIFILGIMTTVLTAILPVVPIEEVGLITLALGVISELVNYFKSGYEDKPVAVATINEA
jgi:5-bromo-4-chloroindolyl phosphate hydrolysis protein